MNFPSALFTNTHTTITAPEGDTMTSGNLVSPQPVGQLLAMELAVRGWTQARFAAILGRPAQFVNEVITGRKAITRASATQIAAALGTSPEMWLRAQDAFHLWQLAHDEATQQALAEVRRRARS